MKTTFSVLFFLLFIGCVAPVPTPLRSTLDVRLKQTHLELSLADFALVGYAIPGVNNESINYCQLSPAQVAKGLKTYRTQWDEKYAFLQLVYVKMNLKDKVKFWNLHCEEMCSCEALQGFEDYLEALNIVISKTEKRAIEKTSRKVGRAQVAMCLKSAAWLCDSQALRNLISEK